MAGLPVVHGQLVPGPGNVERPVVDDAAAAVQHCGELVEDGPERGRRGHLGVRDLVHIGRIRWDRLARVDERVHQDVTGRAGDPEVDDAGLVVQARGLHIQDGRVRIGENVPRPLLERLDLAPPGFDGTLFGLPPLTFPLGPFLLVPLGAGRAPARPAPRPGGDLLIRRGHLVAVPAGARAPPHHQRLLLELAADHTVQPARHALAAPALQARRHRMRRGGHSTAPHAGTPLEFKPLLLLPVRTLLAHSVHHVAADLSALRARALSRHRCLLLRRQGPHLCRIGRVVQREMAPSVAPPVLPQQRHRLLTLGRLQALLLQLSHRAQTVRHFPRLVNGNQWVRGI